MLPAASFLALKTHFKPMTLAPGGASSSLQVLAVFSVVSSSLMAFSQSGQSGQRFALVSEHGSNTSTSTVSAASICLSHSKSSSSLNALSADHTPPASLASSLSKPPSSCSPRAMDRLERHVDDTPTPSINLWRVCDGLRVRVSHGVLPGSASSSPSTPVDANA